MSQCASPTPGLGRRLRRKRHPNYRLVKIHRSYTVEEIATLFGSHQNTVWDWIKRRGLPTIDDRRPMFIHGRDLVEFLQKRRAKNKRKCQPGEIYCLRCRAPQKPAGDIADYQPITTTRGNLIAICPSCESMIYRGVNLGRLDQVRGNLQVMLPQALPHIGTVLESLGDTFTDQIPTTPLRKRKPNYEPQYLFVYTRADSHRIADCWTDCFAMNFAGFRFVRISNTCGMSVAE